jgi:hypothetical protein
MEKRKQIVINKKAQEDFKSLELNKQIELMNTALEKVQDTNKITDELGFSWAWATQVLAEKGAYYVASLKKIIIANPFSTDEICFIKELFTNKDRVKMSEVKAEENGEMTIEEAVSVKVGSSKEDSQNRSFYISNAVFEQFKNYCKAQKNLSNKQILELALINLMEQYPVSLDAVIKEDKPIKSKKDTKTDIKSENKIVIESAEVEEDFLD